MDEVLEDLGALSVVLKQDQILDETWELELFRYFSDDVKRVVWLYQLFPAFYYLLVNGCLYCVVTPLEQELGYSAALFLHKERCQERLNFFKNLSGFGQTILFGYSQHLFNGWQMLKTWFLVGLWVWYCRNSLVVIFLVESGLGLAAALSAHWSSLAIVLTTIAFIGTTLSTVGSVRPITTLVKVLLSVVVLFLSLDLLLHFFVYYIECCFSL